MGIDESLPRARREPVVRWEDGVPVWVHPPGATPVTVELVREILENDDRFLKRIETARRSIADGQGVRLEDLGD